MIPTISVCLLAPVVFSKRNASLIVGIFLLLSAILLHIFLDYPVLGSWSLFTYSGSFCIMFFGSVLRRCFGFWRAMFWTSSAALFFWVWTNFGTWCCSGMYVHNWTGLWRCYVAALPFLESSVIDALGWTGVMAFAYTIATQNRARSKWEEVTPRSSTVFAKKSSCDLFRINPPPQQLNFCATCYARGSEGPIA